MEKTFKIGIDPDGYTVYITLEIRNENRERFTVDHKSISGYKVLSISGHAQYRPHQDYNYCGQIQNTVRQNLDNFRKLYIPKKKILQILNIWDMWHLNDLQAGCVHMGKPKKGLEWDTKEWERLTLQCPKGYKYGTAWLIKELPQRIIETVNKL